MTSSVDALERAVELLGEASERRATGWRALALILHAPEPDLIDALRSGHLAEQVEQATGWLDRDRERFTALVHELRVLTRGYAEIDPDVLLHELKVEHARLFVGPGRVPVPPYESVYRDVDPSSGKPIIMGPTTIAVDTLYQSYGLRHPDGHHDLPDHVATELEFVYFLCRKEGQAWHSQERDVAKELRLAQRAFLQGHLSQWWPAFAARLAEAVTDGIYRFAAEFGTEYLALETGEAYADGLTEVFPPHADTTDGGSRPSQTAR